MLDEIKGTELKVGDTIEVWWRPGKDTVTAIKPYDGPYTDFCIGIAHFAINPTGMTITTTDRYTLISRMHNAKP